MRFATVEAPTRSADRSLAPAWIQSLTGDTPITVSICIANWNCKDLLRACLESLHDQPQGIGLETIVVDNASADGAADMVAREFPEVVLVRNPTNVGFSRANNQAARLARGRFLFFLNNDTVLPAYALARLVEIAEDCPGFGMIGPRLRDPQGKLQISYRKTPTVAALLHRTTVLRWTGLARRAYRQYRRKDFDPNVRREVEVLMGAAVLLPRDVFFRLGGWDEDFIFGGEDIELSVRVNREYSVLYVPEVEILHHGRVSSRLNVAFTEPNVAIGYVHTLRKAGTSPTSLWFYKLVVTLDTPIQWFSKTLQYAWRCATGRPEKAEKSWLAVRGSWHFLTRSLGRFWRA